MNFHAMLTLVSLCALLAGCMFPAGSNRAPGLAAHLPSGGDSTTGVLVLQVIQADHPADLYVPPRIEEPLVVSERELAELDTSRLRWGICIAGGLRGACGIVVSNQLIEICMYWPDGRVLSLGEPGKSHWERETRGYMPEAWQAQLLIELPQSRLLQGYAGLCPVQASDLKWSDADRKMAIDFIKRIRASPGTDGGFITKTAP